MAPAKKRNFLDEDDEGKVDVNARFSVNQEYAKRFQHNKERDELQRLQSKFGDEGSDGSESSEEEDEDGALPEKTESQFAETLAKLRRKDPEIYKADTKFFSDAESEEEDDDDETEKPKKKKKDKPLFLKDVLAKHLIEDGPEGPEEDDPRVQRQLERKTHTKVYNDEQDDVRKAFLEAVDVEGEEEEGEEGEDMLWQKKVKSKEERQRDAKEDKEIGEKIANKRKEADAAKVLEKYFGEVTQLNQNEKFLRNYILNQGWLDKDDPQAVEVAPPLSGDEEDEEEIDKQEDFEAKYNFRFEEPGSDRIVPHPRTQEGTVRKEDKKRKRQRAAKEEREAERKEAMTAELLRLKALKRRDLQEKLKLVREVAGKEDLLLGDEDVEEDFDAEQHDRRMNQLFGDDYYAEEEEDPESVERPVFGDLEDDLAKVLGPGQGDTFMKNRRQREEE
eukprot:CAMPEP_0198207276 /NCGR_PEP_ID=MMETSP1445-20131203/10749_1 /TAXON_ID=36898 /ORGANISM="Pyramimonas sp., Strain CCMP2087" /LENGTH=446 /DNA_ID=CAMNT_0043880255 /DNA_START=65 /DNA_END=1402 /DNA_ORIENTATION=-